VYNQLRRCMVKHWLIKLGARGEIASRAIRIRMAVFWHHIPDCAIELPHALRYNARQAVPIIKNLTTKNLKRNPPNDASQLQPSCRIASADAL
jgi:hypothetical protein